MAMSDPLGDMLTRIRNAQRSRDSKCPRAGIALRVRTCWMCLKREGYIRSYQPDRDPPRPQRAGDRAQVRRGRAGDPRDQAGLDSWPPGLFEDQGIAALLQWSWASRFLSTPRGVMSDNEARVANVGGEVLCRVF